MMREALLVIKGKKQGEIFFLDEKSNTVVGRGEKCEIQFEDASISRNHFCITKQEDHFFVQDMGSSNGTFVNGKRTLWNQLEPGDKISFGSTQLQFILTDDPEHFFTERHLEESFNKKAKDTRFPKGAIYPRGPSVTQPLRQINPASMKEDPSPKLDLETLRELSTEDPDIIFQKTKREPIFAVHQDIDRITKSLSTLYRVSELLHSQLEMKKLLEVLLETVLSISRAQRGCILLQKSKNSSIEMAAYKTQDDVPVSTVSISKTVVNLAVVKGVATVSSDAMSDYRICKDDKSSVLLHNIRSVMCVPLEGKERICGAIYVDSLAISAFDNADLEILTAIGHQAGLAVERTLLQEEIVRSEQKYRTIFEKAPFCIALVNQSGRIMDINPAGIKDALMPRGEIQHSILDVFPKAKISFQKLLEQGTPFDLKELHIHSSQGTSIVVNLKGIPLLDEAGQVEGAMVISEDITEAKKLQSQLIQQDKMATVGLLAAGIAHEFNNIVAGMMGYAQLMLKKKNIDADRLAQVVVEQCRRAREVTSRLLNFSRRKDVPKEFVKLEDLLEDVFELVSRELLKNNIQIEKRFENVPMINAQAGEIQQVFLNLVLNAMYAMGKNGQLTVSLKNDGDWVKIVFQDTGVGIPQKYLPRMFEPFFTTKENQGTGLGLAVSYSIIKSYGGEITVESEENKGATFTIELPVIPKPQEVMTPSEERKNEEEEKDETAILERNKVLGHFKHRQDGSQEDGQENSDLFPEQED